MWRLDETRIFQTRHFQPWLVFAASLQQKAWRNHLLDFGATSRGIKYSGLTNKLTNHVIVHKRATLLDESSNCKCQILDWSLINRPTKFRKPLQEKRKRKIRDINKFNSHATIVKVGGLQEIPAAPSLSPESGFVRFVWTEIVTVKTIATVYLQNIQRA